MMCMAAKALPQLFCAFSLSTVTVSSCGSMLHLGVPPVPYWHCLRVCRMRKQALLALGWQQDGGAIQVGGETGRQHSGTVASPTRCGVSVCGPEERVGP